MRSILPPIEAKGRYSPREAAELLGVSLRTIQRHTNEGYLNCGIRPANGRRFYYGSELVRYWKAEY